MVPFGRRTKRRIMKNNSSEYIILLHGMGRSKNSMKKVEKYFLRQGYNLLNIDYPSTKKSVEFLANTFLFNIISTHIDPSIKKIHFITHSLGGIIVRMYLQNHPIPDGSKIVMLAPPNHGSEVTDFLKNNIFYKYATGEAGQRLTTNNTSLPHQLAEIPYDVGIIAGNKTLEPWFSLLIDGENDGKVSTKSTQLKEMKDFIVVPHAHTFIMNFNEVHQQIHNFIKQSTFIHA